MNNEETILLSMNGDKLHLPCCIEPKAAMDLYYKYFPDWEKVLFDCMEKAFDVGELTVVNGGDAAVKITNWNRDLEVKPV